MFSWERPYRNFTFYYNWVKFTKKILFLKIRSILEILYDFENLRKFWPFLLKTLQFSQYLIKNFQIFCGSSLTHRKYFHQISLNLEHMEIYAAVHFMIIYSILKTFKFLKYSARDLITVNRGLFGRSFIFLNRPLPQKYFCLVFFLFL